MFRRTTRVGLAALALTGSVVATTSVAQAATKCVTGTWKLTSSVQKADKAPNHIVLSGGAGAVTKITSAGAVTFTFTGSQKLTESGSTLLGKLAGWAKYDKVLTFKAAVPGGAKGTISAKHGTAAGNATLTVVTTQPTHIPTYGPKALAPLLNSGQASVIPVNMAFTCTKTALHLHGNISLQSVTAVADWWYRRA
ncbi:MAG TPA: hypothetical protein VNW94_01315 [Streptosporangiaceae bacterium]|nr:hypothetical protein [Streptosporangiaceae bacterium]